MAMSNVYVMKTVGDSALIQVSLIVLHKRRANKAES